MNDPFRESEAERTRARRSDPETSKQAAKDVSIRASSQKAKLLRAFASEDGPLTDERAAIKAGISLRSCFWKRCSELRDLGLITFTGDTVTGSAGSAVGLSEITDEGRRIMAHMIHHGSATIEAAPTARPPQKAEEFEAAPLFDLDPPPLPKASSPYEVGD